MFDDVDTSSPSGALVAVNPAGPEWQPILHVSNQIVLYNPTSHALSIQRHSPPPSGTLARRHVRCPYCHRSITPDNRRHPADNSDDDLEEKNFERASNRAANYFQLLEIANESSRPASPASGGPSAASSAGRGTFRAENMAEGYFKAFFQEVCRLGMGANGSVYLCQHVLDGNSLGYFAVKKVAVGQSHSYLFNTLREVRLLEKLHHPNIITYHHAWLEPSQFSSFGPRVPTLHILMQWAEGGSLDDLIDTRLGRRAPNLPHFKSSQGSSGGISVPHSPADTPEPGVDQPYSRNARIRAFRAVQRAPPEERERLRREMGLHGNGFTPQNGRKAPADWKAVHLLSAEEVHDLFEDVVTGLAFLHEKSILHLDLKPGNVLLTWDEGRLVPRAMLSDFGTSQDMLNARTRSGNTGTLEYSAPESLPDPSTGRLLQVDSKADMWSLGMILHKLLFFRLPYHHTSDNDDASRPKDGRDYMDKLEAEILGYPGFRSSSILASGLESRRLPKAYLLLLETLLNVRPAVRPSSERVLGVIKEGGLKPVAVLRGNGVTSTLALARAQHVRTSPERTHPALVERTSDASLEEIKDEDDSAIREKKGTFLGYPIPAYPRSVRGWSEAVRRGRERLPAYLPRRVWVRTLKSSVLVAKVLTLSRMCPDGQPRPIVAGAALALAIMDTWFEGLQATLLFGAGHLALLSLVCTNARCCD
ncbi:kinase-like protein [Dichomitus squalens]|uniref:non-specific serine/threonine protein kinase n=1 Tax=Dichomitus squalens TaxID=114155 RepID=A0A4Q9MQI1_9APHY|nr:kinase-like protein [Dichomitus squalens]